LPRVPQLEGSRAAGYSSAAQQHYSGKLLDGFPLGGNDFKVIDIALIFL